MKNGTHLGDKMSKSIPEAWQFHLLSFLIPFSTLWGNYYGGYWTWGGIILALVIYPIFDQLFGEDVSSRPTPKSGTPYEMILIIHGLLNPIIIATLCWRVLQDGNTWTIWVAGFSTGISTGVSGIVVGHELGHAKPRSFKWWLARCNLVLSMYSHFTTEHNYNHHKNVATKLDSASAPQGRGLWLHIAQTVPLQFISAWKIEVSKAKKKGRSTLFLFNYSFIGLLIELLIVVGIWYYFGSWVAIIFLYRAAVSIFLLEYVNYIQHYGLRRETDERQTMMHSWQSEKRWSRWTLLELPRHAPHHLKASQQYWQLKPYENAPTLPTGYFGLFWPCLITPLWHRWMAPIIPSEMNSTS
jgi:alkane 1-monooxygenase